MSLKNRSTLAIFGTALGVVSIFVMVQITQSYRRASSEQKPQVKSSSALSVLRDSETVEIDGVAMLTPAYREAAEVEKWSRDNDELRITDMQDEIRSLNDRKLAQELEEVKSHIYNDLIDRLNRQQVSADEQIDAKHMLERLALLEVEKAARRLADAVPELEQALKKRHDELAEARAMLLDD